MNKYGYTLAAAILGATAFGAHAEDTEVASTNGYSLSVDVGYVQSRSDQNIQFAYNSSNNGVYEADLGDGSLAGITFRMPLGDAMGLSLRYRGTSLQNDQTVSVGSGDCNIGPTLGLITDCWDASRFDAETTTDQIDVAIDFPMNQDGTFQFTPFVGVRYLNSEQDMYVDYYYNGGVTNFITDANRFNGYGLFAGIKTRMDLCESMYLSGNLSAGKLWGDRSRTVYDYEIDTPGATYSDALFGHRSASLNPWTAEVELAVGFEFGDDAPTFEVGYQGNYVENLIQGSSTNPDAVPANSIGGDRSLWEHSVFGRVTFAF